MKKFTIELQDGWRLHTSYPNEFGMVEMFYENGENGQIKSCFSSPMAIETFKEFIDKAEDMLVFKEEA